MPQLVFLVLKSNLVLAMAFITGLKKALSHKVSDALVRLMF